MNRLSFFVQPLLLSALVLACPGCEGLGPAIIGGIQSELAESEREEALRQERGEERQQAKKDLLVLEQKGRDLDAALLQLEGLTINGEKELEAAHTRWKGLHQEILGDVPSEWVREVKLSSDPEEKAHQEATIVPLHDAYQAIDERLRAERAPMARRLIEKGIAGQAPRRARTLLFHEYNQGVNTRDEELRRLAREVGAQYDAYLLTAFRKYGGWGKTGTNKVGCVFSSEPWPEELGEVGPRFQTHFAGSEIVVHVLGRLPLAAENYGGRAGAQLWVQLISDNAGFVDVAESVGVGRPEVLGKSAYVRAAFELPQPRFDHSRFFFDVRVLLTWEDGGRARSQVLSQSAFSWQAD